MKLLGIDYGTKRIGLAISDDGGRVAFPYEVVENNKTVLDEIFNICNKENINKIVIGESKNYYMKDNNIMREVGDFASKLSESNGIEIVFHPELMSSMQASKEIHHTKTPREQKIRGEKNVKVDAQAATIVLQSYIDSNK